MTTGRIAVTGVGIVSALGQSAVLTFERLMRGERGFSQISLFDTAGQRTRFAGEVTGFDALQWEQGEALGPLSRSDALALAAARDAMGGAGRVAPLRLGIAVGATTGGMLEAEAVLAGWPSRRPPDETVDRLVSYPMSNTTARLARAFGAGGRTATVCSACSSGASAIIEAVSWLRNGDADCVLAGGTDALCRLTMTGFNALGAADTVPCRPFDAARAGLTLGEGAAFLVLEPEARARARGARILAWLSGWAAGAEAHHITQPEPTSRMPARLLTLAMERAGLRAADVDYLNAHGTGTSNDAVESAGIHAAFGGEAERLLVSSSKGQLGHALGAAGALEAAITVLALDRQCVPPTGGLQNPDPACALNHVLGVGRPARLRAALSSAFGFGGAGAVLLFEETAATPRDADHVTPDGEAVRLVITGTSALGGVKNPVTELEPSRSRRFDVQTSLVTLGVERALGDANLAPQGVGLVAGVAFGSVERTSAFLRVVDDKGPRRAPPAEFPHLLPSSPTGNASIYLGLTGPVMTACDLDASAESSLLLACDLVSADLAPAAVAGGVVVEDAFSREILGPVCDAQEQGCRDGAGFVVLETEDHAVRRGARLVALVVERRQFASNDPSAWTVTPPREPVRALTVGDASLIRQTSWSQVRALSSGSAECAGERLALAARCLERADADEVLVVGKSGTHGYAFVLRGPS